MAYLTFDRQLLIMCRMSNTALIDEFQLTRGWRLRMAMEIAGVSVNQAAEHLEVSRSTVSRWLHDDPRSPMKGRDMRDLALLCGVDPEWLVSGRGNLTIRWNA